MEKYLTKQEVLDIISWIEKHRGEDLQKFKKEIEDSDAEVFVFPAN